MSERKWRVTVDGKSQGLVTTHTGALMLAHHYRTQGKKFVIEEV